jgi:Antibiotic biosynthesis monooxygenase
MRYWGRDGSVAHGRGAVGNPEFTADSEEIASQAIEAAVERGERAQQESGCLQCDVFRSALRAEHYVLLEHWEYLGALAVHAAAGPPPQPRPGIKRAREDYFNQVTSTS